MDREQYLEHKEEDPHLYEKQSMGSVSDTTPQPHAQNRLHKNFAATDSMLGGDPSTLRTEVSSLEQFSSNRHTGSRQGKSTVRGGATHVVLFFCFLVTIANIAILSNTRRTEEKQIELRGGDFVQECPDFPNDQTCFEVRDAQKRLIYRMTGGKRYIGFSECSGDAPETASDKCIGELAFYHKASSVWNYRLYHDGDTDTYSIVAGPHDVDLTDDVFRVRHMLQSPYNWIISKEAIPQDKHPKYGLFIKGKFLFDGT
jgi:hypothetical protein